MSKKESVPPTRASSGLRFLHVVDLWGGLRIRIGSSEPQHDQTAISQPASGVKRSRTIGADA